MENEYSVYGVGAKYPTIEEARIDIMKHLRSYPPGAAYYLMKGEKCLEEVWKISSNGYVSWTGGYRAKRISNDGSLKGVYSIPERYYHI